MYLELRHKVNVKSQVTERIVQVLQHHGGSDIYFRLMNLIRNDPYSQGVSKSNSYLEFSGRVSKEN